MTHRLFASVAAGALLFAAAPTAVMAADESGSEREISLYRDQWGVPHIYADREEDGYFALGYATASDRLEQLMLIYLATTGRLAATFGAGPVDASTLAPGLAGGYPDAVDSDREVRRFRILETARANLAKLPASYRADLESYIAGVERFMTEHPERRPAWAPKLEAAMPLAVFQQLISEPQQICATRVTPKPVEGAPLPKGSDAWVAGPSRTKDGGVIFSSDSHGPWTAVGTLFYPWRMKAGAVDVMAFEPTGSAMPFFGHTQNYAWGWTEAPRFPGDCYAVETDPADPAAYVFDGKRVAMDRVPYRIDVKDAAPIEGVFEYTRHNGLASPVMERRGNTAYVVSYAYMDAVGLGQGAMYRLSLAAKRADVEAAFRPMNLYPANLLLGGADGMQMYIRAGITPKRDPRYDLTKPLPGNVAEAAWQGFVSFDEAVKIVNPDAGYIANNNVSPDMMYPKPLLKPESFAQHHAFDVGQTTTRQQRAIEQLENARAIDDRRAIDITMDEKVFDFDRWAPVFAGLAEDARFVEPSRAEYLRELARFDGVMRVDSRSALYFDAFWDALAAAAPAEASGIVQAVLARRPLDVAQTTLVADAAAASHDRLKAAFGRSDLTYGDVHRIGRGQEDYPTGGGGFILGPGEARLGMTGARMPGMEIASAMRAMAFQPDPKDPKLKQAFCCQRVPFVVGFHPGKRTTSYSQMLVGISDDPESPHFDDQAKLVSERRLRPNLFYLDDLLAQHPEKIALKR